MVRWLLSLFSGSTSFSNYAYTELWRSDIDDIGQAVLIASTAVELPTMLVVQQPSIIGQGRCQTKA